MMPPWLQRMLVDTGRMSESGLTRRARIRIHKPCRMPILAGYDADVCALDAWCDPAELSADGELQALLEGRWTYELHGERLDRRDAWSIHGRPAGQGTPVLAEHRCHQLVPSTWTVPPAPRPAPRAEVAW